MIFIHFFFFHVLFYQFMIFHYSLLNFSFFFNIFGQCHYCKCSFRSYSLFVHQTLQLLRRLNEASVSTLSRVKHSLFSSVPQGVACKSTIQHALRAYPSQTGFPDPQPDVASHPAAALLSYPTHTALSTLHFTNTR